MAELNEAIREDTDDVSAFIDTAPYWVIWQTSLPANGRNRIRRISQDYATAARAEADAERFRQSGAVTWVEEARPLAPLRVPAAAIDALHGRVPRTAIAAIGGRSAQA